MARGASSMSIRPTTLERHNNHAPLKGNCPAAERRGLLQDTLWDHTLPGISRPGERLRPNPGRHAGRAVAAAAYPSVALLRGSLSAALPPYRALLPDRLQVRICCADRYPRPDVWERSC
jgi:hypothetical protein